MDYFEPRDDLDEPVFVQTHQSPVQKLFEGTHIFITGASGFMGRVLLEKILRSCNVAQIYILLREKKGVKSKDRLSSLLEDQLFEPVKLLKPGELRKVQVVCGDCSLPNLGLSEHDKHSLSHVNFIFHAAATLAMDQHLKTAFATNVMSTKALLEFATTLPTLKAFMYISTAYTHAYRDVIEEKLYKIELDEGEIENICNELDDAQIGALTPKLVGRWENTYALTKALTESLISKYREIIPIGIVRPSIVVSTWREPLRGWINNMYGHSGVGIGIAMGLLRLWCCDPDIPGDIIPVDIAINSTLAATWQVATSNGHLKVYNLVSSNQNPITNTSLMSKTIECVEKDKIQFTRSIGACDMFLVKSKTMFGLYSIWYHAIPAIIIDLVLWARGKQPRLAKLYAKVYNINKSLLPYCADKYIKFTSDNTKSLWVTLDPVDKQLFNMDLTQINWKCFTLTASKGSRVYFFKDPMETINKAIKHNKRLRIRKIFLDSIVKLCLAALAYTLLSRVLLTDL